MSSNKKALVVGGSGGIGFAISRCLSESGYDVAITYNSNQSRAEDCLAQLKTSGNQAYCEQVSLEDPQSTQVCVDALHSALGGLDAVIYAAGPKITVNYVSRLKLENWRDVMSKDADACFNVVNAVLPIFKENKRGSLVAVTTTQFNRSEIRGVLSAAPKAAIELLMRAVAKEEARNGIRANTVRAGWVDSQGLGAEMLEKTLTPAAYQAIIKEIPMNRLAESEEIARAVCFLASDHASYITGQSITADGGMAL